jgi:peptidylprolyl isomerase
MVIFCSGIIGLKCAENLKNRAKTIGEIILTVDKIAQHIKLGIDHKETILKNTLPKGIFYKVLATGDGKSAQTAAVVSVYYRGSLIDGKVFDDNTKQGYADAFRLRELITGWQIAIPKMHEGDKWEIYIPSELGYGKRGCPPDIPGNSTLIFEIELVKVN